MKSAITMSSALVLLMSTVAAGQTATAPKPSASASASRLKSNEVAADYRMVPGDKLRIEVYKDAQLSQSLQIRPDGKITLPLVGDVPAAGATPLELAATLTERFRDYLTTPVVTVIVAEAMPAMVYVMGEVNTPGAQPLREPITVLQALAVAGGFRDFAKPDKIRILRKGPGGALQTIKFNYKAAVEATDHPFFLQAGDTIIVP
jgi:polysaccharide export outer membrane protein